MNGSTDFIPFARPVLGPEEEAAVVSVLRSGWLTTGREAKAFEAEMAATVGVSHALAVSSATAGLHLALEALGVGTGDLVATTPYTFTATAEVARYLGADPLFVDIEPDGFNVDAEALGEAVARHGERVRAILPVHVAGEPCDMRRIREIATQCGAAVVEDAAHAFPVATEDGYLGAIGDAGVYSFYANKTITTGEGGMILTNRDDVARRAAVMRLHGIDREAWDRYTANRPSWAYAVVEAGYKYNMPDLAAAIGRVQLTKAGGFLRERTRIAEAYRRGLADCDFLTLPRSCSSHAWHLFIIRLKPHRLTIDRDAFIQELYRAGIGASVHYIPLHLMPYYQRRYGYASEDFPNAAAAYRACVSLPVYPGLTEADVERVIQAVRSIGERNYALHGRYPGAEA
jgi:dTDP-4-amino-4,6-dideoxygalactose transaminase